MKRSAAGSSRWGDPTGSGYPVPVVTARWTRHLRRVRTLLLLAVACAACSAKIDANPDQDGVDASTAGDDAAVAIDGAGGDAAPVCANGRVVFLQFDGQTLTKAAASDATQNLASWMTIATGTAPPYKNGSGTRTAEIQAIVDGMRAQLAPFNTQVVTTRPTSGDYLMIVYGGQPNQVGSRFGGAVQALDCGDAVRNDVAWVSDNVAGTQRIVNFSIGAIGFGFGLTATLDPQDCMCGWDNQCTSDNSAPCTLTEGIARDPNANQRCAGVTTQDETTTFTNGFCN